MSTLRKDITELLGLQGWEIIGYETRDEGLIFHIDRDRSRGFRCSGCGEVYMFAYDEYAERTVRDFHVWGKRSYLSFREARVDCSKCGVKVEKLDWLEPYQRMTVRYEKYLASLCDFMPVSDVSEIEGVNKDTLYRLDKKWLDWRRSLAPEDGAVRYLGIDEISLRKGFKYASVFYDLERSMVIGLVRGHKQRNVSSFLRKWGKEKCLRVEAVCSDLWSPFHNSVRLHLKNAALVFDKFHIFKYLSDAIDGVRRTEQNKAEIQGRNFIKGVRWILLKKDLDKKQSNTLKQVMELNEPIAKAMILKDDFDRFYQSETQEEAIEVLADWCEKCQESGLPHFKKLAKRLNRWKDGILAFFKYRITNAVSEGINNKIKVIKRRSYGFHDMEYFFSKILQATGRIPRMMDL